MEVDKDTQGAILAATMPLIGSALAAGLVAAAATAILDMIATNDETDTMAGKNEVHPTGNATSISDVDVVGAGTKGKLAGDEVTGVGGEVTASDTEAAASTMEATAADTGATAARTKAGASDIEVKALKIT
jgi:hypothetical protein